METPNKNGLSWFQLLVLTPHARLRFILILGAIGWLLQNGILLLPLGKNGRGTVRERKVRVKVLNISAPCIPHS